MSMLMSLVARIREVRRVQHPPENSTRLPPQPHNTTMLTSTNPTTPRRSTSSIFTPTPSSPLSPRTSTITTTATTMMLPSPPRSPCFMKPMKRAYKPVPSPTAESRRSLFLKKVQIAREEKAWEARGGQEEIMRMLFVAEQKRWRAIQEKAASRFPSIREEEEEDIREGEREELPEELMDGIVGKHDGGGLDDFEEFLDRDGKELEDLLSLMDLDLDQKMADS